MDSITPNLDYLTQTMASMDTISFEGAQKALKLLDSAPREALQLIVDRRVKFLWMPANRRLDDMKAGK